VFCEFVFSSWVKKLRSICSSTHIIGMYKYNSKIEVEGKVKSLNQLNKQNLKDAENSITTTITMFLK